MRFVDFCFSVVCLLPLAATAQPSPPTDAAADDKQEHKVSLGNILFNDPTLSNPPGQSCANCHMPDLAFAESRTVSEGRTGALGTRNAPSLMYAKFSPAFTFEEWRKTWVGGQFWDGRVDSLAEQALGPLLNPIEMNNTPATLATRLRNVSYRGMLEEIYGKDIFADDNKLNMAAADALQAFQMSETFAPFTSKFDYAQQGLVELTEQEKLGRKIYDTNGACIDCHAGMAEDKLIFTQFSYHNILTPPNPAVNNGVPDSGAANNPKLNAEEKRLAQGRFKTPTMRNIAVTAPYMHNGVFRTLRDVIEYYNNIDDRDRWGPASFPATKSHMLRTKLDLTEAEIEALIAFLNTLTDGYTLPQPVAGAK